MAINPSQPATIHGQISFPLQKYVIKVKSCNYFQLTSQLRGEYISPLLQELVGYYSNRLSYKEVEKLVERMSGQKLLSDQKIWQIIVNKSLKVSEEWRQETEEINKKIKTEVDICSEVDIYDPNSPEILLFDDAIGVKKLQRIERNLTKKKLMSLKISRNHLVSL